MPAASLVRASFSSEPTWKTRRRFAFRGRFSSAARRLRNAISLVPTFLLTKSIPMRKTAVLALVGLSFVVVGGVKVTAQICGALVNQNAVCGNYNVVCPNLCTGANGNCPGRGGAAYNQVGQSNQFVRGTCGASIPPNPGVDCTDQCDLCTTNKYFKQAGDIVDCDPNRRVCTVSVSTPRECQ